MPNQAYSTAKFAVRGFTEALIEDLRTNAPQVRVAVVFPGHVGTDILRNTHRALGKPAPEQMTDAQVEEMLPRDAQEGLIKAGLLAENPSADDLRQMLARFFTDFRDKAPLSAADAATIILDGVRSGAWRILIGKDAKMIDENVRAKPEATYDYAELFAALAHPEQMSDAEVEEMIPRDAQEGLIKAGLLAENPSADDLRQILARSFADFRDKAARG
jgi:NAD(P)-dependent dehydrogenase (short-subunit alcohol dehydrogenase family)